MRMNWIDRLGDWNPQLFREIKGRLKLRNLTLAVASSLLCQLLVLMFFASQLTVRNVSRGTEVYSNFCILHKIEPDRWVCSRDALGNVEINWQLWSLDVFLVLSIIGIFALLVVGSYLLINDLSREENRGTLNFICLSPQSTHSILIGKLLGVPIWLYLAGTLAVPLHLWLGQGGGIPLSLLLSFYGVLAASCCFFYCASLLYGLLNGRLGGLYGWVGSGAVLIFLLMTTSMASSGYIVSNTPADWLMMFSPSIALPHLVASSSLPSDMVDWFGFHGTERWQWFNLLIGAHDWSTMGLMMLNYGVWTYWVWQGLARCFHSKSSTLLSKRQSYLLTVCFEVIILGFALQESKWSSYEGTLFFNFACLQGFNLVWFLVLIAALSPHRQALQDWARYRHQQPSSRGWGLMSDLLWGEKSPALVAIALNLAIAATILIPWILLWSLSESKTTPVLVELLLTINFILISACAAQLMLLMKTSKRGIWASSTVGGLITLPPIIFGLLSLPPANAVWLFSAFGWFAVKDASTITIFMSVLGQWLALTVLGIQLKRKLKRAGESATKALFAARPTLPNAH